MFERVTTDPYYKETYGPITTILKPGMKPPVSTTTGEQVYDDSPWVITIDDFITPKECTTLIELGRVEGYKRSKDVGEELFDGTYSAVRSHSRTSTNAWCAGDCYNHSVTQYVLQKIENLTSISDLYAENLQLLQYDVGQFYQEHHDYIEHDVDCLHGVRILTVYLYLNDVDKGGGTNFPQLGVTVMPKRGRVLLWPSVLNDNPNRKDFLTNHQALPVEKGIKYAANGWVHLRDFKTPHKIGCT
jgi:prolyl 4-hydroxylase